MIKQMMKIIRDLKMTKFGKQRFGVLCGYEGKKCLIGLGPSDVHCVYFWWYFMWDSNRG
jgi:hypothetical protein